MEIKEFIEIIELSYYEKNKLKNKSIESVLNECKMDIQSMITASNRDIDIQSLSYMLKNLIGQIKSRKPGFTVKDIEMIFSYGLSGTFDEAMDISLKTISNWFFEYGIKRKYIDKQDKGTFRNMKLTQAIREIKALEDMEYKKPQTGISMYEYCRNHPNSLLEKYLK